MTPERKFTDEDITAADARLDAWLAIPADVRAQLAAFGTIPPGLSDADRGQLIALRGEEQLHCP